MIITDEYKEAKKYLAANKSGFVFLTGKAGVGKTTFLKWVLNELDYNAVTLAPTGIAALNAGGQTIHSFFKFRGEFNPNFQPQFNIEISHTLSRTDLIIIDEISMVRADLLDMIDKSMRTALAVDKPFGGKLILAVGDLYQLPPVLTDVERDEFKKVYKKSPFFFNSHVFDNCDIKSFVLTRIFRQTDRKFINLLNIIRKGTITHNMIERMNAKVFNPELSKDFKGLTLCAMNRTADNINKQKLEEIDSEENNYMCVIEGKVSAFPVPELIELKVDAKIVFCKNTPNFRNGETGIVKKLNNKSVIVDKGGEMVYVEKETWEQIEYKKSNPVVVGKYKQLPLKLGWAITIHKSQGMTFSDKIAIDTGNGCFASGQFYVAMSRITDFANIQLLKKLRFEDVRTSENVLKFMQKIE